MKTGQDYIVEFNPPERQELELNGYRTRCRERNTGIGYKVHAVFQGQYFEGLDYLHSNIPEYLVLTNVTGMLHFSFAERQVRQAWRQILELAKDREESWEPYQP